MIRILIICLLIALCNNTCDLEYSDLRILQNAISVARNFPNHNEVDSNAAIIFFGFAKSGKSTLVNYLIPNDNLYATRLEEDGSIKIIKTDNNPTGPNIADGPVSETKIPSKWTSKNFPTFSLWDPPGFKDTRGVAQDIVNSIYINQLIMNVKTLRIVLVDDRETNDQSFQSFWKLLRTVKAIFKENFINIFSSIAVIFTKVDFTHDLSYINELKEMLNLTLENEIEVDIKDFVEDLIKTTNNRIGLFKVPKNEGTVGKECDINIIDAINSCQDISNNILQNVSLCLDPEASVCMLSTLSNKLLDPYYSYMAILQRTFLDEINMLKNDLSMFERQDKIKPELIRKLTLIVCAKEEHDFEKKFNYLKNISVTMKQKIENFELQTNYNLIAFLDELLKSNGKDEANVLNDIIMLGLQASLDSSIMQDRLRKSQDAVNAMKVKLLEGISEGERRINNKTRQYVNVLEEVKVNNSKNTMLYIAGALIGAFALIFLVIL